MAASRALRALATLGVVVLATVLLSELAVRVLRVPPRRVLIDAAHYGPFTEVDGLPLWADRGGGPERVAILEDAGCDREEAFRVLLVGDSIFNGVELPPEQVASVRLKRRLEARGAGVRACVVNLAVPGFSLRQGMVRAVGALDALDPHVVVLEVWGGAPVRPVRIGERVILAHGLRLYEDGFPNPYRLPGPLNRALLHRSRLYELLVLAAPDDCPECRVDLADFEPVLDAFLAEVRAGGGDVVTVMPALLSDPFSDQHRVVRNNRGWEAWIAEAGVRNVRLWEAWAALDPAALAFDDVHLDADGHEALADTLDLLVAPAFARWEASR